MWMCEDRLRSLKAKHRPRSHDDHIQYKPAVGRDTNTGPLVATTVCVCVCVCVAPPYKLFTLSPRTCRSLQGPQEWVHDDVKQGW